NQMIEQAFALLETVKTDAAPILTGRYANEPRIQSLKELLAVAEHMILAGAKMEPAAKDVAELIAEQERKAAESAKPAETAPASVEGEKAKEGAAPAEPAAGAEAPKLGAPLPNMLTPRGPAAGH
ncbi:MAG: hypothetical protein HYU66_17725, partial [Armatimonadetes bacterium]|nr:hypothetical protein [Armatimonadota bacterium]